MSAICTGLLILAGPLFAQTETQSLSRQPGGGPATVADLFADFLHFSLIGRFDLADTFGVELLKHPDLDPVEILHLSEQHKQSIETLIVLVNNSTIAESAARILELIREGEHLQRKDTDRILANIQKLGGPPQTEYNAIRRLSDSGEYAIPWMIQTLRDDQKRNLWPRVIRALPQIGKGAVGPLVMALQADDQNVRRTVVETLGELGYAQAIPYLQTIAENQTEPPELRRAAVRAIEGIARRLGRLFNQSPAAEFVRLAEQYYREHGSLKADPRLNEANLWYWDANTGFVTAVPVLREIFGPVMAMRCCQYAMPLNPDDQDAIALWLAANIRREARLDMNVESDDSTETGRIDPTRPADFPRALYFTSAAGARYAHMVLGRALSDHDAPVALGAIAALRRIAGPSSLIGTEDHKQPLVEALKFPDLVVRSRAALALGNALPRSAFVGKELVVPTLTNAITQTGFRNMLVIEPDEQDLNRVMDALRAGNTQVIGSDNVFAGLQRARDEFESTTAIFLASDVQNPGPADAIRAIRGEVELARKPIILMVKPGQAAIVDRIVAGDEGVETVDAAAVNAAILLDRLASAAARLGQTPVDPHLALELALAATRTIHRIAADGRSVFGVIGSEPALIAALDSVHEELQLAAIDALALVPTAVAQAAIAQLALQDNNDKTLRIAGFTGLAESAKRFGNGLDESHISPLMTISFDEPDLQLRTAASHALGALNLQADKTSEIIHKYHGG